MKRTGVESEGSICTHGKKQKEVESRGGEAALDPSPHHQAFLLPLFVSVHVSLFLITQSTVGSKLERDGAHFSILKPFG